MSIKKVDFFAIVFDLHYRSLTLFGQDRLRLNNVNKKKVDFFAIVFDLHYRSLTLFGQDRLRLNNVNKKKWIFLPLCSTCIIFVHFKTSYYFR